jgi:hypothetical protein
MSDENKLELKYQYQMFKKIIKDSIDTEQTNKITLMLQPIIQKQDKEAQRQLELIKQLQLQIKQLQKQMSQIQKSISTKKR